MDSHLLPRIKLDPVQPEPSLYELNDRSVLEEPYVAQLRLRLHLLHQ